ncbi:hypothetical protein ACFXJ5_19485 [Streptomyces sp. NPDC059373]
MFAGSPLFFVATGYNPFELVTARLDPSGDGRAAGDGADDKHPATSYALGTFRADRFGVVRGRVIIPRSASGRYIFSLTGQSAGLVLTAPVVVKGLPYKKPGHFGHRAGEAGSATGVSATRINADPVAHRVTESEPGSGSRLALAGTVAALTALAGSRLVLRRRGSRGQRG